MNSQTEAYAKKYLALNWNIIPVNGKKAWDYTRNAPLYWERYKREQYDILNETVDCGIAVVLGAVSGNLVALDLDKYTPSGGAYVKRKAKDLDLIERIWNDYNQSTYAQTTPRGYRLFFTTDLLPPNTEVSPGVDIKAEAHYVVLAPSTHPSAHVDTPDLQRDAPYVYEEFNQKPVMHIEGSFYDNLCALYNLNPKREAIDVLKYIENGVRANDDVSRNYVTLAVTEWYRQKGYPDDACIAKALEVNAKSDSPDKERDVVKAARYQLSKHYAIRFKQAPSSTVDLSDVDLEFNMLDREIKVCGGANSRLVYEGVKVYTRTGKKAWVLICYDNTQVLTCILPEDDSHNFPLTCTIGSNAYIIRNYPAIDIPGAWQATHALNFAKTQQFPEAEKVFQSVLTEMRYFVDVSNLGKYEEAHHIYNTCYAIATYFYEAFNFFPMHVSTGIFGCGKTTEMKAVGYHSYHHSIIYANPSGAVIFRIIETCKPTLLMDNIERMYAKEKMDEEASKICEMIDVGAYANGVVPRVEGENPDGTRKIREYGVYCPKMMTAVMGFAPSMMSRAIESTLVFSTRPEMPNRNDELQSAPVYPNDTHAAQIQQNRNDLYALRLKLFNQVRELSRNATFEAFDLTGREFEKWKPILVIAKLFCLDKIPMLVEYAKHLAKKTAAQRLSELEEAVTRTLIDLASEEGWIELKRITEHLNQLLGYERGGSQDRKRLHSRAVSEILNKLGFVDRKRRGAESQVHVFVSFDILSRYAANIGERLGAKSVEHHVGIAQRRLRTNASAPHKLPYSGRFHRRSATCPHCNAQFKLTPEMAKRRRFGLTFPCPQCGRKM